MGKKIFQNKKNGQLYEVDMNPLSNATNANEYEIMLQYTCVNSGMRFVREIIEFQEKFEEVIVYG